MSSFLEITDLDVSYGAIRALKKVNIKVEKGSITAILGANGGGKSTLLKTISGIVDSQAGTIMFEDHNITKYPAEKITNLGIIHIPEGRQIFGDLTVFENLMIGSFTTSKGRIKSSLLRGPLIEKYKGKTEIELSRKEMIENNLLRVYEYFPVLRERSKQIASSLSGGEQQMLAVGRGLMSTPKLLILDEPSLGLAPLIVRDIFKILKELNKELGLTILIVEQNALQTLKIADYGYVLQVGNIVREGKAEMLANDPALIEAYLGK